MVSSISSSTDSLTALQKLLTEADTNADATVSKSELTTALGSDSSAAQELVAAADTDGDDTMSLNEFITFADKFSTDTGLTLLSAQEGNAGLNALFTDMDSDGSASVTASEITAAQAASTATDDTTATETVSEDETISATGVSITTDVEDLLDSVDANGDGVFDKNDMAKMFLKADSEASGKDADKELSDTKLFIAATSALDTDKDGVVSDEEKAAYS